MEANVDPQQALQAGTVGDPTPALQTDPRETHEFFIDHDYEVYTSDGQKIGVVEELLRGYMHIKRGVIFTKDLYIPVTCVSKVEIDRVYLGLDRAAAEKESWEDCPPEWS